eukprot:Gb_10959 [translate_table: standard]
MEVDPISGEVINVDVDEMGMEQSGSNTYSSLNNIVVWRFVLSHLQQNNILPSVLMNEDNTLDTMVNKIYPKLLETTVKGDDCIEIVKISWNHLCTASWIPSSMHPIKNEKGEIMGEVVVEAKEVKQHGDAWRIVFDACLSFMHLLDARQCIPYSIHEAYKLLGIPTAYQLIAQRLSVPLKTIGKGVFREHLLLVFDCMTYIGNILGFNPVGY